MRVHRLTPFRLSLLFTRLSVLLSSGIAHAGDNETELRSLIEQQAREIEQLQRRLNGLSSAPTPEPGATGPMKVEIEESALRKVVSDYLADNPGAGLPSSVQAGWYPNPAFTLRSAAAPTFVNWQDECTIPFELRIRGRVQLDYYSYKVTDNLNHQTVSSADCLSHATC